MSTSPTIDQIKAALPAEYVITHHLASGGQGAVFRGAYQGKSAAIKIFFPGSDDRRLERELALLQEIECPSLVAVLGTSSVTLSGMPCALVAYEYHAGGDLKQFLDPSCSAIALDQLLQVGKCVMEAISELWRRRIVHRDVKPANIVRTDSGGFVLVDVGLARHLNLSDITMPGRAAGTPGYMSPEQARGRRSLTLSSDVFSLGVSLYELATREHPFSRSQHLIGVQSPKPIRTLRPEVPEPVAKLIHQMMEPVPSKRVKASGETFQKLGGTI